MEEIVGEYSRYYGLVVVSVVSTTLLPFAIILMTSFIKISIVLFVLRNASGLQQTPSNMVLNTITLLLVIFIHTPIAIESYEIVAALNPTLDEDYYRWWEIAQKGFVPFQRFMLEQTTSDDRGFFLEVGKEMYENTNIRLTDTSLFVLLPAFTIAELTAAFQIGVLIFLPFLAIDVIVTNILTALNMNMMTPTVISLPFKLLLFVGVDGWSRLASSLILSYF